MMRDKKSNRWQQNLLLTAGIMATVLIALVMAQLDALQAQRPPHDRLVIVNVQATTVADGDVIRLPYGSVVSQLVVADPNATVLPDANPRAGESLDGSAPEFTVCGEVPAGWLLYTVQSGDTVSQLAAATQSDASAILTANCLVGDELTLGMQILLPSQPIEALRCGPPQWWVRYQVRVGDTMAALARSRGTTVAEILRANCRDSEALAAGQMIFLPPGGPAPQPPVVAQPSPTPPPQPVASATLPPSPSPIPSVAPTTAPIPPTAAPTIPVAPTRVLPTATAPVQATATAPVVPTAPPPTRVPPTEPPPTEPPPPTSVPTRVPPTPTVPPTDIPPTATAPPPPPTSTPLPPPTNTPEAPTATPETPPTNTPAPEPTSEPEPTPEPEPTETWYRPNVWQWYWS